MTERRRSRRSLLAALSITAVVGAVLAGCAQAPEARTPSTSETPTAACPRLEDVPDEERDCAVYDPDAAMAENERYREQLPVAPEDQAELDALVEPARAALDALPVPATVDDVVAALVDAGLSQSGVQTTDNGTGVVFGAFAHGGCLNGFVAPDGTVTVETGGIIMDGGCLAMTGH